MRMPSSVSGTFRIAFVLLVVIGAVSLINAARQQAGPTVHDKLYYADANLVNTLCGLFPNSFPKIVQAIFSKATFQAGK